MLMNSTNPIQDLMRQNVQKQLSLLESFSGRFFNASLQLAALNEQAGRKLMEESVADVHRALKIQTIGDAQQFIGEQSKLSVEKMRGYWQNVQNIANGTWAVPEEVQGVAAQVQEEAPAASDGAAAEPEEQHAAKAHGHKQHDADPHPSPLVEKLIASVAVESIGSNSTS